MDFDTAAITFMSTGTILFVTILKVKRVSTHTGLMLAAASVVWGVLGWKYWGPTFSDVFPESLVWMNIFIPIIGVLSAMTVLGKSSFADPPKDKTEEKGDKEHETN